SQRAGHDLNYLGYAGVLGSLARPGAPPPVPGPQLADVAGGSLLAVIGTLAALVARGVTGRGQVVDAAMLDGSLAFAPLLAGVTLVTGDEPLPGAGPLTGALPGYNIYATADERYVTLGALEPKFWAEFCQRVGRPDLIARQFPRDAAERDAVIAEVAALFRSRPRAEWLALLADADACLGPVNTLAEAFADPQIVARGVIGRPAEGGKPMLRSVPLLSATPARLLGGAPALGADTAAALAEVGYTQAEIAALHDEGAIAIHATE
ncbi:MAG: CoA transferase, partial [Chloroflexota bacterium]|nr:CoA transferase [Chloroflexota bacterium]